MSCLPRRAVPVIYVAALLLLLLLLHMCPSVARGLFGNVSALSLRTQRGSRLYVHRCGNGALPGPHELEPRVVLRVTLHLRNHYSHHASLSIPPPAFWTRSKSGTSAGFGAPSLSPTSWPLCKPLWGWTPGEWSTLNADSESGCPPLPHPPPARPGPRSITVLPLAAITPHPGTVSPTPRWQPSTPSW